MPNGLIEGYEKILKIFFGDEHKKSISAVIYFTAGIIGLIAVLSLVMPFSCSADAEAIDALVKAHGHGDALGNLCTVESENKPWE